MLRHLIASVVLVMALSACGIAPSSVHVQESSCIDVPSGACQEQADRLVATAGGPVQATELTCVGNCTRAGGAGNATLTLENGTTQSRTWSYTGDPNPLPNPVCVGLPRDVCVKRVQELADEVVPSHHLTTVSVTCSKTCDERAGDVLVVFKSDGGLEDSMGTSWGASP
jgi:hypothetical protein